MSVSAAITDPGLRAPIAALPDDQLPRRLARSILRAADDEEARVALWREVFRPQPVEEFSLGGHLFLRRTGYEHHGLYLGDGWVVHYSGEPLAMSEARVQIDRLDCFAAGDIPHEVQSPLSFAPERVCARALGRYGEARYNLLTNNCEHFVNWCRSDRQVSLQVRKTAAAGGVVAATAVIGLGVYAMTRDPP